MIGLCPAVNFGQSFMGSDRKGWECPELAAEREREEEEDFRRSEAQRLEVVVIVALPRNPNSECV